MNSGQIIHATQMPQDSFYLQAKGVVISVKGDRVQFQATEVMDKYSKKWSQHPTSCATSCKLIHAQIIN